MADADDVTRVPKADAAPATGGDGQPEAVPPSPPLAESLGPGTDAACEPGSVIPKASADLCIKGWRSEPVYCPWTKYRREAARQGDAEAQFMLGADYEFGLGGVAKDETESVWWYLRAALQGHAPAQFFIGCRFYWGEGLPQDFSEAARWYRRAAENGDACGQHSIGECYHDGLGVKQDYAEAVAWFRKSAEQGNADGQNSLGNCYGSGEG
ncbi:MAG: tetratricopeptide repeat protein, partial [Phycisphaerae bacterium]